MSVPGSQIGQSAEAQLLRRISKQLDQLIKLMANSSTTTTTTTSA